MVIFINGRGIEGMRTPKAIYAELNRPIRGGSREPVEPGRPARTPRPRRMWQKTATDTRRFAKVNEYSQTLEGMMATKRRGRAARVMEWIEECRPGPIEILRRIASESAVHERVLSLICDELEKFPPGSLEEGEIEDGTLEELNGIKVRSCDMQRYARDLEREEDELLDCLEEVKQKKRAADEERRLLQGLLEASTFAAFEQEKEENAEIGQVIEKKQKKSPVYNELWGVNRHLREELEKLQQMIDAHRKYHEEFTTARAMGVVKSRMIQDVELITEEEKEQ